MKSLIKNYYSEKQLRTVSQHVLTLPKPEGSAPITIRPPGRLGDKPVRVVGPGQPPPGFLNPWNSLPEWILYWALWQVLHEEGDAREPRRGGFYGGRRFRYQVSVNGGRHTMGGSVADFEVTWGGTSIFLWLQGDIRHLEAGPERNAIDLALMMANSSYGDVRPIYEKNLIADPTGEQACRTVVETLGGRRFNNPAQEGTYQPTRAGRLFGGRP